MTAAPRIPVEVGRIYGWTTFRLKGVTFFAWDKGNSCGIINAACENYGAYHTLESFRKMYTKQGEALNLTNPGVEVQP